MILLSLVNVVDCFCYDDRVDSGLELAGELFLPLSCCHFSSMLSYSCTYFLVSIELIEDVKIQPLDFEKVKWV